MHSAGVPLMVGTDTGTCGVYPGFSVYLDRGDLDRMLREVEEAAAAVPAGAAMAAACACR
jgi:hypothetical protein